MAIPVEMLEVGLRVSYRCMLGTVRVILQRADRTSGPYVTIAWDVGSVTTLNSQHLSALEPWIDF